MIHVAVLEALLLGLKLGIYSVVLANIVFALVMCLLNARSIARTARYRQEIKKTFVLPSVCSLLMGVAAYGVYRGWQLCSLRGCFGDAWEWPFWLSPPWLRPWRSTGFSW